MSAAAGERMRPADILMIVAMIGLGALLWWWSGEERARALRESPMGFDGLAAWLRAKDQPARVFIGWSPIDADSVGLRVLPLFDADLDAPVPDTENDEDLLHRRSEVDIRLDVLRRKIALLPTLVILPKWKSGMRLTGKAHPELLIEGDVIERLVSDILAESLSFKRHDNVRLAAVDMPFSHFGYDAVDATDAEAVLYQAQALAGTGCKPIVGSADALVLGECWLKGDEKDGPRRFLLLTDPDLFNSHGLRLGGNALIASDLLGRTAEGAQIVIDYTTHVWAEGAVNPERSWSDLLRFFGPPFGPLWAGLAAATALILWRASVRYGAPLREDDPDSSRRSRRTSAEAKARLLRLSGHDGALLTLHVEQRMDQVSAMLLGPQALQASDGSGRNALVSWLARRDPDLAGRLERAAAAASAEVGARASTHDSVRLLNDFENTLEQVLYEFGRPAGNR